MAGFCLEEDI